MTAAVLSHITSASKSIQASQVSCTKWSTSPSSAVGLARKPGGGVESSSTLVLDPWRRKAGAMCGHQAHSKGGGRCVDIKHPPWWTSSTLWRQEAGAMRRHQYGSSAAALFIAPRQRDAMHLFPVETHGLVIIHRCSRCKTSKHCWHNLDISWIDLSDTKHIHLLHVAHEHVTSNRWHVPHNWLAAQSVDGHTPRYKAFRIDIPAIQAQIGFAKSRPTTKATSFASVLLACDLLLWGVPLLRKSPCEPSTPGRCRRAAGSTHSLRHQNHN